MRILAIYSGVALVFSSVTLLSAQAESLREEIAVRTVNGRQQVVKTSQLVFPNGRASISAGATAQSTGAQAGQASVGAGSQVIIRAPNYVYVIPKAGSRRHIVSPHSVPIPPHQPPTTGQTEASPNPDVSHLTNYLNSNPPPEPPEEESVVSPPPASEPPPARPAVPRPAPPAPKPQMIQIVPKEKVQPISQISGPLFNDNAPLLHYQKQQAEKGNPESQYALGMRYLTGAGVEQSDVLARQWLQKSSAGGNLQARGKLKELPAERSR